MEALMDRIEFYVNEYGSFNPLDMETPYEIKLCRGVVTQIHDWYIIYEYNGEIYNTSPTWLSVDTLLEILYACMLRAKEIEDMINYFESKFKEEDFAQLRA